MSSFRSLVFFLVLLFITVTIAHTDEGEEENGLVSPAPTVARCAQEPDVNGHVEISRSSLSIEPYSFVGCVRLQTVVIGSSVTSIGMGAFAGCTSLRSVNISQSVTSIGIGALPNCFGYGLVLPEGNQPRGIVRCVPCASLAHITLKVVGFGHDAFQHSEPHVLGEYQCRFLFLLLLVRMESITLWLLWCL